MPIKLIPLILCLFLLCSCATDRDGNDSNALYNANKEVQQPQAKAWGWLN